MCCLGILLLGKCAVLAGGVLLLPQFPEFCRDLQDVTEAFFLPSSWIVLPSSFFQVLPRVNFPSCRPSETGCGGLIAVVFLFLRSLAGRVRMLRSHMIPGR